MIVGYVFLAAIAGLIASVIALLVGATFWFAFGLYTLIGSATLILLPLSRFLLERHADQSNANTDRGNPQGNAPLRQRSLDQEATTIETSMRILAVDDDPFILELIPMISANAGFPEVTPAASGEHALELLARSDVKFDCLLLDISMPGMDGIELCRRIRQMSGYSQTPIVMLTAMRDIAHMGDAYRAGATDYATKPFDIEELSSRLRIAQEMIQSECLTGFASQEALQDHHRTLIPSYNLELPAKLYFQGVESLIDYTALSSYLTQLPKKEVADVQVFAISIDGIEAFHEQSSSQQVAALLNDLGSVAAGYFGADLTLMAYTNNMTLLIATNSVNLPHPINIEIAIERRLQRILSDHNSLDLIDGIGVSVGGPARPQGAKAARAGMTTNLVIAFAENRSLGKQGRQIAGMFTR